MTVDRKRLRELALAATPGPWQTRSTHVWSPSAKANIASASALRTISHVGYAEPELGEIHEPADNAAYIAAANPQTILELLDALEAAEQPAPPMGDARDAAREEWRKCGAGYEVSNLGRVRSVDRVDSDGNRRAGRVLQPYVRSKGYLAVSLWSANRQTETYVHRLVAGAFLTRESHEQTQVNHRDGDKTNNAADNLEWCSAGENSTHAMKVLHVGTRSVIATNVKTGKETLFNSLAEAEQHGFVRANIQHCIAGRRKLHGGHTWRDAAERTKEQG